MTAPDNIQLHSIVPFVSHHQADINDFMLEIQKEFDAIFTVPNSRSISELIGQGDKYWVALHQKKTIGTIGLLHFNNTTGIIKRMFVAKDHRGQNLNLSKRLLDAALAEAKRLGYTTIYLGTMDQFKAAQSFYSKNNFVQIPKTSLPDNMVLSIKDTIFYELKLN